MSEKKNIDKLFKEQLKDFEVAPSDAIWKNIERELRKDKRKRRIIPIWWKFAGVAAIVALLFTAGNSIFSDTQNSATDIEVVDSSSPKSESNLNDGKNSSKTAPSKNSNTTEIVDVNATKSTHKQTPGTVPNHSIMPTKKANNSNTVATSSEDNSSELQHQKDIKTKHKTQKSDAIAHTSATIVAQKNQENNTVNKNDNLTKVVLTNTHKEQQSEIDKRFRNVTTTRATEITQVWGEETSEKAKQTNSALKPNSTQGKILNENEQGASTLVVWSSDTSEKENTNSAIDTSKINSPVKEVNAIETAIAASVEENDSILETEANAKRWSVAPNAAPVYFNSLGQGSSLDNQFVSNTKEGEVTMSFGVKGSYTINNKLKIRAGINKVDLGYSTNNVLAFDGASSVSGVRQMKNVELNDSQNSSAYVSANTMSFDSGPEILFTKEQGSINQQLGFIEVPVELEYMLVNKKIGFNLIGGFSTLFLNTNEIYSVENNGSSLLVGEATNINSMSYSANFGVGANYNFSEQLQFNLEPMFKYQINTFNDTSGDFQPFFIGVYTGLSFKF